MGDRAMLNLLVGVAAAIQAFLPDRFDRCYRRAHCSTLLSIIACPSSFSMVNSTAFRTHFLQVDAVVRINDGFFGDADITKRRRRAGMVENLLQSLQRDAAFLAVVAKRLSKAVGAVVALDAQIPKGRLDDLVR